MSVKGSKRRILIVDVDKYVLMRLEQQLEDNGFETTTTWDLDAAMGLLTREHFDLLVVAHHPPQCNALEALQLLGSASGCPCLVLYSAAEYPFEQEHLRSLGAAAVLCKWGTDPLA